MSLSNSKYEISLLNNSDKIFFSFNKSNSFFNKMGAFKIINSF